MEGAGDRDKLNICESRPDSSIHTLSLSLTLSGRASPRASLTN